MRSPRLALAALLALAACAPRPAGVPEAGDGPHVTTEAGLGDALGQSGFPLSPRGFTTTPLVRATASEYVVGGTGRGYLRVYTFDSADEARRSLNEVATDLVVGRDRVYQSGALVVAYYGRDAGLGATLTRLLGPPRI